MKKQLVAFWYSLPVQLLLLHGRKYQVFLLFWYILFATIAGDFLNSYGAVALYLAPEYLGKVNVLSTAIVGIAVGVFFMSWNVTTFILHSKLLHFLATTSQPFLKYCINNSLIPLLFLLYYLVKAIHYQATEEFSSPVDILILVLGFAGGFCGALLIAFLYFFTADKSIYLEMRKAIRVANTEYDNNVYRPPIHKEELRVDSFFSAILHLRKPRDVSHYSDELLETTFKRHHFAAVYAILVAFIFLVIVGFFSDNILFQLPAAASITILFAILIAVSGAFSLFLKSWSIPLLVLVYSIFNYLYVNEIFDPRNKAYGLDYPKKSERPLYNQQTINALASDCNVLADKAYFLQILNNWKKNQTSKNPTLFLINVSGGGTRSATFTMNTLQKIDSLLHGSLMKQTILINGASGGMLGAAYYRELYLRKMQGSTINLQDSAYVNNIAKDLLNPLFSSFVTRDIIGPVQKFRFEGCDYVKDRGYAFEQQLNKNTNGLLDKQLKEYSFQEQQGIIPMMVFNPVISKDGKKMIISSHSLRFLMKPSVDSTRLKSYEADAIDFNSLFAKQHPTNIKMLSALRMNATFPYVLPNVWLPVNPIIDVVDAGLRDNYGQELSLRMIEIFKDWLQKNTASVVLIQIRDTPVNEWENPADNNSIISFLTKPLLIMQNNWFNIQDYYQHDQLEHFYHIYGDNFKKVCFQYVHSDHGRTAGLSFHLTAAEKKDISTSLNDPINQAAFRALQKCVSN